ncbi:MAG: preprotein translocase subunit SecA, partial [Armatimonadetes bacterium]|nr:preprotein translocase subunit SecA [Armatimonadota bacterium]
MPTSDIPLVGPIINKVFGTRNERVVRRYLQRVEEINALEPQARKLTDEQIRAKTAQFKERLKKGEDPTRVLPEAFAVAREAMDRNIGLRNMFNPRHAERFPVDRLSPPMRALYDQTKAALDALPIMPPEGAFLGNTDPQPGWVYGDIPVELYEAARELFPQSRPPFRARPFDVQLIGGMVLFGGKIAEMKTGEGKTIVGPLACYMAVLEGWKVHVVTVNDYLVQRDRDWTYPFFRGLGLTVGAIHPMHMQDEDEKRLMYACDVVYGTTAEFGFDFLRDNMKRSVDQQVQRVREYAIVDEVDSILIDEARTPLIISGPAHEDSPRYELANQLAIHLVKMHKPWADADELVEKTKRMIKGTEGDIRNARDKAQVPLLNKRLQELNAELPRLEAERDKFTRYFEVEKERKQVHVTHHGVAEAQKVAGLGSFYVGDNIDLPHLLSQAVRAHAVYERDVDYVVMPTQDPQTGRMEPDIVIVDVNTGRPMVGRQWSDGLHQACQAKEGLRVRQETQTVASVTIQNFFKMYKRLAGMTGTADTEAQEFNDIYKLDVVTIPTNVQVIRRDFDDVVYLTPKDKWEAIVDEIKNFHDMGRPVLVGTTSVEKSEMLSRMLTSKHGIKHEVLNAKQHEREAHIVENAGALGAVMIATNMAGRGTDIKMQPVTREQLLDHWLRRGIAPRELTVDATDEQVRELIFRKIGAKELGLPKHEVEKMPFAELELALLRHWAQTYTFVDPKRVPNMKADECRKALDEFGRFRIHRIGWAANTEQLGGLHVIGTERHESRRIDNQLRGRSGRQGDQGSSRFFVSLEDDLMKMFAGETTMKILSRLGMKEGDAIEHPMLSKSIVRAQRKVEERNFQIRKNILEYDEVAEHQRRDFYATRQRVLEGRGLKDMIFEYIRDSAESAVARYLDKDYRAESIALYASDQLGASINPERLKGRDEDEMEKFLRKEALDEARHEISVTVGEYIQDPSDDEEDRSRAVERDSKGLSDWAERRFGLTITPSEIDKEPVKRVRDRLEYAAEQRIDAADLSGLSRYLQKNYGAAELARWLKDTLDLSFTPEEIAAKEHPDQVTEMILAKVRENYEKREKEYAVEFTMDMAMMMARQNPAQAMAFLAEWASKRVGLSDWTPDRVKSTPPNKVREELLAAYKTFVESDRMEKAVQEAIAVKDDDALEALLRDRYNATFPLWMKRLKGEERDNAVRSRVEGFLRAELLQFERFVLLEVLDNAWKDHLYAMDQTRDAIGFRAFSQQDPRIEFKREGSRLYKEMQGKVRDRVAEYIFKMRLRPQMSQPPMAPPARAAAPAMPAATGDGA